MAQTTQRGMPTSYVKKDGTTFQYCGSGAPVAGLAAATRAGGQLKRNKDNTPEACALSVTSAVPRTRNVALPLGSADSAALPAPSRAIY